MNASELIAALEEGHALGNKLPDHGWVWFWQDDVKEDGHNGNYGGHLLSIDDCLANVFHNPESWYIGRPQLGADGKETFCRSTEPMTVRDLMAILVKCNPDDTVIASRDSEGNGYSRVWTAAEVKWVPEWAELLDFEDEDTADGLPEGTENAVCIWPG